MTSDVLMLYRLACCICLAWGVQNRRNVVPITSERTATMNEILNGIKLIKMYAWEGSFAGKISEIRRREVAGLLVAGYLSVVQGTIAWIGPTIVTFATFTVHALMDRPLEASQVCCDVGGVSAIRPLFIALGDGLWLRCRRSQRLHC